VIAEILKNVQNETTKPKRLLDGNTKANILALTAVFQEQNSYNFV